MRSNYLRHLLTMVCLGLLALTIASCEDEKLKKDDSIEIDGESYLPLSFTMAAPDDSPFREEILPENITLKFYLMNEKTSQMSVFTTRLDYEEGNVTCQMLVPEKSPLEDGDYQLMLIFHADDKQYPLRLRLSIRDHECVEIGQYESLYKGLAGEGTKEAPYLIGSHKDLLLLHQAIVDDKTHGRGLFFQQAMTIDLNPYYEDLNRITDYGWPSIAPGFSGTYDGNGCTIDHLMIRGDKEIKVPKSPPDTMGFFHSLGPGAHILNLSFTNVMINAVTNDQIGVVAGTAQECRIEAIGVSGNVSGQNMIGGFVGEAKGVTIYNCTNDGLILSGKQYIGGLFGKATDITVSDTDLNASLTDSTSYIGGVAGYIDGISNTITDVKSLPQFNITGKNYTGGIAGCISGACTISGVNITYTTTKSTYIIKGEDYTGGLVGEMVSMGESTIKDCHVELFIKGNNYIGGFVGLVSPGGGNPLKINDCHTGVNGKVVGKDGVGGVIGRANDDVYVGNKSLINTLRFQMPIEATGNHTGGVIGKIVRGATLENLIAAANVTGNQTVGGIIGEADNARLLNCRTDSLIRVQGNGTVGGVGGAVFNPEISKNSSFSALVNPDNSYANKCITVGGLFGFARGTSVNGVTVRTKVRGKSAVGGFIGSTDESVTLTDCVSYGSVSSLESNTAGFVGLGQGSKLTIDNCMNHGDISGNYNVGGILGYARVNYTLQSCRNKGKITAKEDRAGGIVGFPYMKRNRYVAGCLIRHCANLGSVTGKSMIGGIAGGTDKGDYRLEHLIIMECANGGTVTGTGDRVGGIIGFIYGNFTIESCYNTAYHKGDNQIGGILGNAEGYFGLRDGEQRIYHCYNTGNSDGHRYRAGIIGWKGTDANLNSLYVSYCYNAGSTGWGIFGGIDNRASYDYKAVYYSNSNSGDFSYSASRVSNNDLKNLNLDGFTKVPGQLPILSTAAKLDF